MAKYAAPGGNRNKNVKTHKSTATMKPQTGEAAARSRRMVGAVAAMLIPGGKVASSVGKAATRAAAKKYATKAGETVSRTATQGRNTRVTVTPPKRTGAGPNSPVRGTKVTVERTKRSRSAAQQAASSEGRKARNATRRGVDMVKAGAGTAYVMDSKNRPKKRGK